MELPSILIGGQLSAATRRWLKRQPIRFIEKPFTHIQFRQPNLEFFNSLRDEPLSLIVTSSYAAHWLVRFRKYLGADAVRRIFCVSEKQKDILTKARYEIFVSKEANMLSLAETVHEHQSGLALYFRGDRILNDLFERLLAFGVPCHEIEVYKNTPIETLISEVFDAYLFFSPAAIESYKASGNFPSPKASIMTSGQPTALKAWTVFPNTVKLSPEEEELLFVKYSVERLIEKLKEPPRKKKLVW